MIALAHAISQQPPWWRPHTPRHLRLLQEIAGLAPDLCRVLDSDDDTEVAAVTEAAWSALAFAAGARLEPAAPTDCSAEEARRLLRIYDAVWLLMQALSVLAKVPPPKKREARAVTDNRTVWGIRCKERHLALAALLEGRTP